MYVEAADAYGGPYTTKWIIENTKGESNKRFNNKSKCLVTIMFWMVSASAQVSWKLTGWSYYNLWQGIFPTGPKLISLMCLWWPNQSEYPVQLIPGIIIHQIFSLARDWFKRNTWLNIPQLKLGNIRWYSPNARCEKYLKNNKHNNLHLALKICSDICPWTLSVPRSSQFSSLLGTDNVRGQIRAKWRLLFT